MRLAFWLAWRFQRGRHQDKFLGLVSFAAFVGITLGCFALILLLSVMNGFERELKQRILAVIPHGELYSVSTTGIEDWQFFQAHYAQQEHVVRVDPYVRLEGLVVKGNALVPLQITGMAQQGLIHTWQPFSSEAAIRRLYDIPNGVLLGKGILKQHGLSVGDSIQVMLVQQTNDTTFKAPEQATFVIAGEVSVGGDIDYLIGVTTLTVAAQAGRVATGAQGLRFMFDDAFIAPTLMRQIGYAFPQAAYMSDWTRTHGHLYQDIRLVRVVVYLVLTLVIGVACFNIVSTLVMTVREKQKAIGILRSMGASDRLIRLTFVIQGVITGTLGTLVGTLLALLIVPNISSIMASMESLFGVSLLSSDVYFVDFLPVELHTSDVMLTVCVALMLTFLATLYPSRNAVKMPPAQAVASR